MRFIESNSVGKLCYVFEFVERVRARKPVAMVLESDSVPVNLLLLF